MRQLKITQSITNRASASLEKYLQDIAHEELLSTDEEVELAQRIISAETNIPMAALRRAGATFEGEGEAPAPAHITKADLLDKGLIGPNSTARRAALQQRLGLPAHLTANGLLEALTLLLTREEFDAL